MNDDADRIAELYTRHALAWANKRQGNFPEQEVIDRYIAMLPKGAAVLDLGCGSGVPVARHLSGHGCDVTGVDTSPELLDLAQSAVEDGLFLKGDMRGLSLGQSFDGILAWHSSFHLGHQDQRDLFDVFESHAHAGTILMFTSGPEHGEAIGTFEGEPLYHASLDPSEYRSLLARHGFDVVEHLIEDVQSGGATIWISRYRG